MDQNEYTKREKTGEIRSTYNSLVSLENMIKESERLSNNLMEIKRKQGLVKNKYKTIT